MKSDLEAKTVEVVGNAGPFEVQSARFSVSDPRRSSRETSHGYVCNVPERFQNMGINPHAEHM